MDAEIAALAETLPVYKNLISIKGIGVLSAATFLAAIGDIRDFPKPGNLAAYIGTAPRVICFRCKVRIDELNRGELPLGKA